MRSGGPFPEAEESIYNKDKSLDFTTAEKAMSIMQKITHELREVGLAAAYFLAWIGFIVILKTLILEEYRIQFHGLSLAILGALALSKVVIVLQHVPVGSWTRNRAVIWDVLLRTLLYGAGVFLVIVLEKSFEGRRDHGGFIASVFALVQSANMPHVWANVICLTGALLGYNVMSVLQNHLGKAGLLKIFGSPANWH
jgi:hypothetical protein